MQLSMNHRFAALIFSPNLNFRRHTIKLRQLKARFAFTTLRLRLHTIEYRMPLREEFRLEIFQFPNQLSNPKFRPPALSFLVQKKFRSESLTVKADSNLPIVFNFIFNPTLYYFITVSNKGVELFFTLIKLVLYISSMDVTRTTSTTQHTRITLIYSTSFL